MRTELLHETRQIDTLWRKRSECRLGRPRSCRHPAHASRVRASTRRGTDLLARFGTLEIEVSPNFLDDILSDM